MAAVPSFEEYLGTLSQLTRHTDPTELTPEAEEIREAAISLMSLPQVTTTALSRWVGDHPDWVPVLGLTVGLSREKLKNTLMHSLRSGSWVKLARERPTELVSVLDSNFDLVRLLISQRDRSYDFGDVLVARSGTRGTATRAGAAGRRVEDEIERIASNLQLRYETRTRFLGRNRRTAPCDLAIPGAQEASIVVAAKGFDSTGSKLTDAVREIEEMAEIRTPRQFVIVLIDGIGWKSRESDLRQIHSLWENQQIDGMYTLLSLNQFSSDLREAAVLRRLLP